MQLHTGRRSSQRPARAAVTAARGVEAVPWVDLERYIGRWHGVAWLPLPFQRRCMGELTLEYAPRDDGLVAVVSACRGEDGRLSETHGVLRQPEPLREPARLQLRFAPAWLDRLRFVWNEHWVIGLDRDYRWAVVGEPRRRYLWILGREPRMDYQLLEELKAIPRRMGYDLAPRLVSRQRSD
ncbi:lipocalin family protein [Frateuria edaphi]|uniref:lipocalin family protein n=1 Tax=Frateuria edaphi TaxID=2898793 RepID=UPI001E4C42B2|nr:lipocalin family protein [Frateuria edaphi]UGB45285.1 lipocalin family protein [Frateuria edaphi]